MVNEDGLGPSRDRPASKFLGVAIVSNRWLPQTTCTDFMFDAQAIFRRRRHQPRRPPLAKIRPGRPAPITGPGTVVTECGQRSPSLQCLPPELRAMGGINSC